MQLSNESLSALREGLKALVIKECNVKNTSPACIRDDEPVVGGTGALKLDSLDAVEIAAALERSFDLKLDNVGAARKIFKSFNVMAEHIQENAKEEKVREFLKGIG